MAITAIPFDVPQVRALLEGMYLELSAEFDEAQSSIAQVGPAVDRAGDDDVDAGSKATLREHQISLVASIRERREQVEHALDRLKAGSYGRCERCNQPIAPERLEAFPAATSCVACKGRR